MTTETVHVRASHDSVRMAVGDIPRRGRSGGAEVRAMLERCGLAILGRIHTAFVIKARGGTDEAGDRWAPLSPKTIAYRTGRTRTERKRAERPSQALNSKQQARWWVLYRQGLAIYEGNKGRAARRAWAILKEEGAVTLYDKYRSKQVEILRDTGLLLNSLSPGRKTTHQILRVGGNWVEVGTNRKGAKHHHEGIPGKLPQRRLWPDTSRWPTSWWEDIKDQVKQGLVDIALNTVRNAK